MMLFAAGLGVGLFFFGVSESINWYTDKSSRFGHLPDHERAKQALNQIYLHWCLHGWSP